MKITIKDEELTLKYTIRAIFIFEKITDKAFELRTISDFYVYLYSLILASNPDTQITFNDLVDKCDEDPSFIANFRTWIDEENKKQGQFFSKNTDDSDSKKKSS